MRVSTLPVSEAAGGLLLHTHRLSSGVLRKGQPLSDEACGLLAAAGVEEVMVARLDPGEVAEDAAADRVARSAAGTGTVLGPAHTGRCNLYATRPGLLCFDAKRVDASNLCDWRLTLATLPALQRVETGDLLATVKVLPFAVPEGVLRAAEAAAAEPKPLLRVEPFRPLQAGLVITHLPATTAPRSARAIEAQRTRMERLGGQLARVESCAHRVESVAAALQRLLDEQVDLVLFVGASSVAGEQDVLPLAVEVLGGEVQHIGMPVDPGNLLLMARIGPCSVLGVPGCARSVRTTGFDWVLERIAAGLVVTPEDLMRMGAGGLLSSPKAGGRNRVAGAPSAPQGAVAAIVLAAGAGTRMKGSTNKLVASIDGEPMVRRVVVAAAEAGLAPIVVVTGANAPEVRAACAGTPARFVHNPAHEEGMGRSLSVGAASLGCVDAVAVLLGDMPDVDGPVLERLRRTWREHPGAVVAPSHGGVRGNPVLFDSAHLSALRGCQGDQGARQLLADPSLDLVLVPVSTAAVLVDIDTPEQLASRRAEPKP